VLKTIEAIYENGIFKPPSPVDLPEGARVRIEMGTAATDPEDRIREQLLAGGADPAEVERILDNLRLLWNSYNTLTGGQQTALDQARLDQEHLFTRLPHE
jgi:predicted DNA-binding antitoxin AbrB/MazE fold protein